MAHNGSAYGPNGDPYGLLLFPILQKKFPFDENGRNPREYHVYHVNLPHVEKYHVIVPLTFQGVVTLRLDGPSLDRQ